MNHKKTAAEEDKELTASEGQNGWKKRFPKIVLVLVLITAVAVLAPKLFVNRTDNARSSSAGSTETTNSATPAQARLKQALADKRVSVLLFHSTNCQPCLQMEATIKEIQPEFEDTVAFILIVVNDPKERSFVEESGIQLIPTTFIFNKQGQSQKQVGVIAKDKLTDTLEKLVNE